MKSIFFFLITFFGVYLLLSLLTMMGMGYVIDWIPEATWTQKAIGTIKEGIINEAGIKLLVAGLIAITVSVVYDFKKRYK